MTDILEELAEQSADELWEAVRRGGLPAPPADKRGGVGEESAVLPLSAALGELERQSAALTRMTREETGRDLRRTHTGWSVGEEQSRWSGGAHLRPEAGETPMAGAERLDRLFRRDGRRYDGGFFLY